MGDNYWNMNQHLGDESTWDDARATRFYEYAWHAILREINSKQIRLACELLDMACYELIERGHSIWSDQLIHEMKDSLKGS